MAKNIIIALFALILAIASVLFFVTNKLKAETEKDRTSNKQELVKNNVKKVEPKIEKKYDLYSDAIYDLPFSSIYDISKLPLALKKQIDQLLEDGQGFYLLKVDKLTGNVFIILQNQVKFSDVYQRFGIDFVEFVYDKDTDNYEKYYCDYIYSGVDGEIDSVLLSRNDKSESWKFDKSVEPYRPLKHTLSNEKGKVKYVEYWNYLDKDEVKYQLKNSSGKVVSIMKEIQENEINYRREYLLYDDDGNVKLSLSVSFEPYGISRVTYYNSEQPQYSGSIFTAYSDGVKKEEKIYSSDYKLLNTYRAEIVDSVRKSIRVYDSEEKEIDRISS